MEYFKIIEHNKGSQDMRMPWYLEICSKETSNYKNYIYYSATGNCQLLTHRYFKNLLEFFILKKNGNELRRKELIEIFTEVYKLTKKPLLLIDVGSDFVNIIKKMFGENIILNTSYASPYGTTMYIIIINIKNLSRI